VYTGFFFDLNIFELIGDKRALDPFDSILACEFCGAGLDDLDNPPLCPESANVPGDALTLLFDSSTLGLMPGFRELLPLAFFDASFASRVGNFKFFIALTKWTAAVTWAPKILSAMPILARYSGNSLVRVLVAIKTACEYTAKPTQSIKTVKK
jgi:hypothetical protein